MGAASITAKSVIKSAAVPPVLDQRDWHALEPNAVALLLNVDPRGKLRTDKSRFTQHSAAQSQMRRILKGTDLAVQVYGGGHDD